MAQRAGTNVNGLSSESGRAWRALVLEWLRKTERISDVARRAGVRNATVRDFLSRPTVRWTSAAHRVGRALARLGAVRVDHVPTPARGCNHAEEDRVRQEILGDAPASSISMKAPQVVPPGAWELARDLHRRGVINQREVGVLLGLTLRSVERRFAKSV